MNKTVELDIPLGTLVDFKFAFEGVVDGSPLAHNSKGTAKLASNPSQDQIATEVNSVIEKIMMELASQHGWKSISDGKCEVEIVEVKNFNTKVGATFK